MTIDTPKTAKILEKREEAKDIYTYVLDMSVGGEPGQFVMLWLPGIDEKPFSIAFDDGEKLTLLIAAIGPFTKALAELKVGDRVGVRGAYGKKFNYEPGQHLAMLAGGYGVAPLYFLAHKAGQDGCTVDFVLGSRSAEFLCYTDLVEALPNTTLHVATDDGSRGHKGYNTQVLEELLKEGNIDAVKTCGPEMMMKAGGDLAEKYGADAEISVERYMKCGIGICGNCSVDGTGAPSCLTGPVMPLEEVKKLTGFGKYHRDSLGVKHDL